MRALYVVASLLLATPLFGRLGDTKAALVERFGPVRTTSKHVVIAQGKIIPLGPNHSFQKEGWMIECELIDDRRARIRYHKTGEWTEQQLTLLLSNDAGAGRWIETKASTNVIREWVQSDRATATWRFPSVLEIASPACFAAARVRISRGPTISGRHTVRTAGSATAPRTNFGPIPRGSPREMATSGRDMEMQQVRVVHARRATGSAEPALTA